MKEELTRSIAVLKQATASASIEECCRRSARMQGLDVYKQVKKAFSPSALRMQSWAYTVGCAIAIKKGCTRAADAAAAIGEGLQSFCIPGSVADQRKVGLGHGNLGKMLLEEETKCFCIPGRSRVFRSC